MASSPASRRDPLQRDLLEAFFARERRFFLTGGGALVGFHLGHRESQDLDLFAHPPTDLELAERALEDAARAIGASLRSEVRYADSRRFLATRGEETTLVDLAIDRTPAVCREKEWFGPVQVDTKREIAANKVCTLLSRCEIRDLVDLKALLESGLDLTQVLLDASIKDAGVNPATLAWLSAAMEHSP